MPALKAKPQNFHFIFIIKQSKPSKENGVCEQRPGKGTFTLLSTLKEKGM